MNIAEFYRLRIEEITSHREYHGADPNLVADVYERRLHKITQTQNENTMEKHHDLRKSN